MLLVSGSDASVAELTGFIYAMETANGTTSELGESSAYSHILKRGLAERSISEEEKKLLVPQTMASCHWVCH